MTTETLKGAIYFDIDSLTCDWHDKYKFFAGCAESFSTYIMVQPHEFSVEINSNFDPRLKVVESLKAKREELRAQFAAACTEIERQISQYQAIECSEVTA